jgi:multisubunit Na+/H+ antiporter MnhB subunit
MPLLSIEGAIVHRLLFVLVAMYLLDTFYRWRFAPILGFSGNHQPEPGPESRDS